MGRLFKKNGRYFIKFGYKIKKCGIHLLIPTEKAGSDFIPPFLAHTFGTAGRQFRRTREGWIRFQRLEYRP